MLFGAVGQGHDTEDLLKFLAYEDYLDQFVTDEDLFYLENADNARQLVELGYRRKDFLTRAEFDNIRQEMLEGASKRSKKVTIICSAGMTFEENSFLHALARRESLVRSGKLSTIIFIRDYVRGQEVSAYIDYGYRLATDNFSEYFNGKKRLVPRRTDLSYYNWKLHQLYFNSSPTFQVLADSEMGLLMKHKRDRKVIIVDPRALKSGDHSNRTVLRTDLYIQVTLWDHVTRSKV